MVHDLWLTYDINIWTDKEEGKVSKTKYVKLRDNNLLICKSKQYTWTT